MHLQSANQKPALKHKDGLCAHGGEEILQELWIPLGSFDTIPQLYQIFANKPRSAQKEMTLLWSQAPPQSSLRFHHKLWGNKNTQPDYLKQMVILKQFLLWEGITLSLHWADLGTRILSTRCPAQGSQAPAQLLQGEQAARAHSDPTAKLLAPSIPTTARALCHWNPPYRDQIE